MMRYVGRTGLFLLPILLVITHLPSEGARAGVPQGRIETIDTVHSVNVDARRVDVWLPPGYSDTGATRYPVLYLQDGQNLFFPAFSSYGNVWAIDSVMAVLIAERKIRPAIVVGIWNTPKRTPEYVPAAAYEAFPDTLKQLFLAEYGMAPISDDYLKFLVGELKPLIDKRYRTLTGKNDTFVMGSSKGGLISLYALLWYPETFGGAACVSTHWPVSLKVNMPEFATPFIDYLRAHLPAPGTHRIYFDFGTTMLDSAYEPYQRLADTVMMEAGYTKGTDWMTEKFDGAGHNEQAWRARVRIPLTFLLH